MGKIRLKYKQIPDKASRDRDEEDLRLVRAIAVGGLTRSQAGARFGIGKNAVAGLMHRIRNADLKYSGEPRDQVANKYEVGACRLHPGEAIFP